MSKEYRIELLFRALADHTRLRVIHLLGSEELCVCSVVAALRDQPNRKSRDTLLIFAKGLVEARRDGKWMHYRIVEPIDAHAAEVFREVRNGLGDNLQMRRDRERLAALRTSTDEVLHITTHRQSHN